MGYATRFLATTVTVQIDRPIGSRHPKWGFEYPVNYGYIADTIAPDGEAVDAYVLGVDRSHQSYTGTCIAMIRRLDDQDDKLIVAPDGIQFSNAQIRRRTWFQEKYFASLILRPHDPESKGKEWRIVSLQGGMAVGKTTLAQQLEQNPPDYAFSYENPIPQVQKRRAKQLNINKKHDFVQNQRIFIAAEIERFDNLGGRRVIMDRGPEDIECYSLNFPPSIGADWDIESALAPELAQLRKRRSDLIIYLDADSASLRERRDCDPTRSRSSFASYIESLFEREREWFWDRGNTVVLPADDADQEQLRQRVLKLLSC